MSSRLVESILGSDVNLHVHRGTSIVVSDARLRVQAWHFDRST